MQADRQDTITEKARKEGGQRDNKKERKGTVIEEQLGGTIREANTHWNGPSTTSGGNCRRGSRYGKTPLLRDANGIATVCAPIEPPCEVR
jgi:hypothetical protein